MAITSSHGAPTRRVIDEGHVKGKNFVQFGLNSTKPGMKDIKWMRENQIRFHFMSEIERDGWPAVMKKALAEALDGPEYIFISIDTDVLDPAWAPGMGTPEPGGMGLRELFPMLRALGVQNKVVGVELVELNPLTDHTYRSPLVAVRIASRGSHRHRDAQEGHHRPDAPGKAVDRSRCSHG